MQPREPGILTSNLPITGRSAPITWATAAPATNHNKCCSERTRKVMADVFQHRKIRKKNCFPGLNNLLGRSNIDFWVYEVPLNAPWSPCQHDLLGWGSDDSQYSCQHDSFCTNISLLSKFDLGECSFSLKHWYLDFIKRFLIISLTLTLTLNIDLKVKAMFLNQPSSWLKRNSSVQATGWFTVCCSPST